MVRMFFKSGGKEYVVEMDLGTDLDLIDWMLVEGNYSCDCNRSHFIHTKYPEFPDFVECGESIDLVKWEMV